MVTDNSLRGLLQQDYTEPGSESSLLYTMNIKSYLNNPEDSLFTFNQMILRSGLVRDFITQNQRKIDQTVTQDKKEWLLKSLFEKRGLHHISQIKGVNQNNVKIVRDVVVFPYCLDYMLESSNQNEVISVNASFEADELDRNIKEKKVKDTFGEGVKFQEATFKDIKIDHLNWWY